MLEVVQKEDQELEDTKHKIKDGLTSGQFKDTYC